MAAWGSAVTQPAASRRCSQRCACSLAIVARQRRRGHSPIPRGVHTAPTLHVVYLDERNLRMLRGPGAACRRVDEVTVTFQYGKLKFATRGELDAVERIEAMVRGYLAARNAKRPLSIAVFGAPGSGKSTSVKAIRDELGKKGITLVDYKLNLTQLSNTDELGQMVRNALNHDRGGAVPLVFFDEFDAPKAGTPLGWLSWFLAPMEDGEFFNGGGPFQMPPAVFIFAGGTAHRAADFGKHDPARFRAAKGPDFASRLRGFLDVVGPNDGNADERRFRRESAFEYQLKKELATKDADQDVPDEAEPALLDALRDVGRFRHGIRSIGAVLELCARRRAAAALPSTQVVPLSLDHLPDDDDLALHVDRGPLDADRIGGAIGMSCNFDDVGSGPAMKEVALELWRQGARLAYFRGDDKTDAFTWGPTDQALAQPTFLSRKRYAVQRVVLFVLGDIGVQPSAAVDVVRVPGVGRRGWARNPERAVAELFRMRWTMNSRCVARVLVAGEVELSPGRRTQGLLEEAMLALVTGQPVYILGAFGGSAVYLGGLLGLATDPVPDNLPLGDRELAEHVATLGGALDLPTRSEEIPDYLSSFAIGSRRWPDNGLSVDENRELFASKDAARIRDLIRNGLLRRFDGR